LDISDVSPDSVAGIKAAGLRILAHDGAMQAVVISFWDMANPQKYALADVRVRKALSLALNRKELADKLFSGYAEPDVTLYIRPTGYFWDSNVLKPDPYDPEGAKKLLAQAGYPGGFKTTAWLDQGVSAGASFASASVGYYRQVGIGAELVPIEVRTLQGYFVPKMRPEIFDSIYALVHAGGVLQFEKMATAYHSTKGVFHNNNNPKLDALIDQVPMTKDLNEKKKLALEAAVMGRDEYSAFSALGVKTLIALSSKVGGLSPIKGMAVLGASLDTITHAK
ncbi:MAG: ABC transporter substrate-binding protein, partial [Dehalococcoidia bacterium]|nr:ABC transporter substrate-binding protein [Dehalococcoidia bacterium]